LLYGGSIFYFYNIIRMIEKFDTIAKKFLSQLEMNSKFSFRKNNANISIDYMFLASKQLLIIKNIQSKGIPPDTLLIILSKLVLHILHLMMSEDLIIEIYGIVNLEWVKKLNDFGWMPYFSNENISSIKSSKYQTIDNEKGIMSNVQISKNQLLLNPNSPAALYFKSISTNTLSIGGRKHTVKRRRKRRINQYFPFW